MNKETNFPPFGSWVIVNAVYRRRVKYDKPVGQMFVKTSSYPNQYHPSIYMVRSHIQHKSAAMPLLMTCRHLIFSPSEYGPINPLRRQCSIILFHFSRRSAGIWALKIFHRPLSPISDSCQVILPLPYIPHYRRFQL